MNIPPTFSVNTSFHDLQEWRNLVQQHDADGDGKLAADELLSVAEYLTKKHVRVSAIIIDDT